ncbi:glycosyltransferase [Mucilaginibacter lacusdianchii]|uniref:glycosyltransferase n=1 Tax=Mucilaginibacter lacusdianchii TaxID=2684211 RepID=UPI00131C1BE9|nr:glycosyltransferase [Mucilaginibacter sp. JXJ CY 39]
MKILHVIGAFDKKLGGTYSAILSIMAIENELGYDNEVLSLYSEGQEFDADLLQNRVHLFEPSFPYKFNYSAGAYQWLKEHIHNFDLILIHEAWGALAIQTARLANSVNTPYAIWPHGSLDPFDLQKKKQLKKVVGKLLIASMTRNAGAICCTSGIEKSVLRTYNKQNNNINILPLPIDYEAKGDRKTFREKLGISDDKLVFLFLSRVDYKKGLDLFLYAYKAFLDETQLSNTKLVIAGKGQPAYEAFIRKTIHDLNLEAHVVVSGFLTGSGKADAFAGSDCFILPSMNENYGISVIEALQSGLPVLISDNVYIWESIIPNGGWLCKHEVKSITAQISAIYNDFTNNALADKKPVLVSEPFRLKSLIPEYRSFYHKMLYKPAESIIVKPQVVAGV